MNDVLKYMTEQFVEYLETPPEEKRKRRQERKEQRQHWTHHWFGLLPMALRMLVRKEDK